MVEQRAGRRGLKPVTLGALPVILANALAILVVAALYASIIIPPTSTTPGASHSSPRPENAPGTRTKTDS